MFVLSNKQCSYCKQEVHFLCFVTDLREQSIKRHTKKVSRIYILIKPKIKTILNSVPSSNGENIPFATLHMEILGISLARQTDHSERTYYQVMTS